MILTTEKTGDATAAAARDFDLLTRYLDYVAEHGNDAVVAWLAGFPPAVRWRMLAVLRDWYGRNRQRARAAGRRDLDCDDADVSLRAEFEAADDAARRAPSRWGLALRRPGRRAPRRAPRRRARRANRTRDGDGGDGSADPPPSLHDLTTPDAAALRWGVLP